MFQQNHELREYIRQAREIDQLFHQFAMQVQLSDSEFLVLYTLLEEKEGCLQKDICEMYSIKKQTIHSTIKKLERENVIYLKQVNRGKGIYLTDKGKRLIDEKIKPIAIKENDIFEQMDSKERSELIRITEKYLEGLRKLVK